MSDPNCPSCGGYHVRAEQCPEYQPSSKTKLYDGRTLVEKLRKDAADYRWAHLADAALEIDRLRAALTNIADSIDRGYCCHVETDAPHDLRACLRRIAKHAKEILAGPADETNDG